MMAERPITQGESIVHSYGDSLTAAQLLQTFGFVMPPSATTTRTKNAGMLASCLSKNQHLLPACQAIKQSGIPRRLQTKMKDIDEQETWDVADLPVRDTGILADDVLIGNSSSSSSSSSSLTDELITFACLQFLPKEAYQELQDDNGEVSLLDASILDDLYLGILVCRSLLLAIHKKLDQYDDDDTPESKYECMCVTTNNVPGRLASLLEQEAPTLLLLHDKNKHRYFYGWAIRTEELTSLQTLCTNVSSVMGCLYEELKRPTAKAETLPSNKRLKVQYDE
jgi:hypothetical protein